MESFDNQEKAKDEVKGRFITGRPLKDYIRYLHFDPSLLKNQRVLNVGCGSSDIGSELKGRGVETNVIDMDIDMGADSQLNAILREKEVSEQNRDSRGFILAEAESLPFKDQSFDTILVLQSAYQIPKKNREKAYREFMRVGNAIFMYPIGSFDFRILERLSKEEKFEIIVCHPFNKADNFFVLNPEDYQDYKEKYLEDQRIQVPEQESLVFTTGLPMRSGERGNFNYIVLKRVVK